MSKFPHIFKYQITCPVCTYLCTYPIQIGNIWHINSVQLLSHVWLFATPWTAPHQASLSITSSQSLLKLLSIELVTPSNHLILCPSLLFPPSIFPSIRVFSNESILHHHVVKVLKFHLQHQSFQWIFRTDFL